MNSALNKFLQQDQVRTVFADTFREIAQELEFTFLDALEEVNSKIALKRIQADLNFLTSSIEKLNMPEQIQVVTTKVHYILSNKCGIKGGKQN
jgi:hypothetical protein